MKKCLFLMLMVISVNVMGQTPNYAKRKDGALLLTNVEKVDTVTSMKELYRRALLWVSDMYKNPKSVIQTQDADAGILVVKGNIPGAAKSSYQHKLMFEFKDGKYRWTISDIYINFAAMMNMPQKRIEDIPRFKKEDENLNLENLNSDFISYIISFQKKILENDEW